MLNKHRQRLLLALICISLAGCGFRLRGSVPLPPALQETRIVGVAEYAPLAVQLRRLLLGSGARVLPADAAASATLTISGEETKKRVLSVDAQGRAAEYELTYRFNFEVTDSAGKQLVPRQSVELLRDYRFDPDNVLATGAEEAQIREEMYRFGASQALRRINAVLRQQS